MKVEEVFKRNLQIIKSFISAGFKTSEIEDLMTKYREDYKHC